MQTGGERSIFRYFDDGIGFRKSEEPIDLHKKSQEE